MSVTLMRPVNPNIGLIIFLVQALTQVSHAKRKLCRSRLICSRQTKRRNRRLRHYNRLEKERTDFTQSENEVSLSPEVGTSREGTSLSESESSDSSSTDSDNDDSLPESSGDLDSDSDDSTSGSSSDSESDTDESSSGSSSYSDSGSCSCSSASSCSSDDSDSNDDDARKVDLRFERNSCLETCVCRSSSNMLQITPTRRRRTEQSLYYEVLSRQLLKSYYAAREIDLRFEENPYPETCVCRSSRNMLKFTPTHRRNTEPPLYRVVLSRRLLRPSNRILHDCCEYRRSRRWHRPGRTDLD